MSSSAIIWRLDKAASVIVLKFGNFKSFKSIKMEESGNGFVTEVQPGENVMTITVVRSSNEQYHSQQRFIVTERGVVGSLRNPQDMEVYIGR